MDVVNLLQYLDISFHSSKVLLGRLFFSTSCFSRDSTLKT